MLYDHIPVDNANHQKRAIQWSKKCNEAFFQAKGTLYVYPVLAFADFGRPFWLQTDASTIGQGTVLYQEQEGKKFVIGFASRALSRAEARYAAHKLKFLTLKWAVTDFLGGPLWQ